MKIALLATGFPRNYKQTFDSWYHFLFSKYDVDMYIASWDKMEVNYNPHAVRHLPKKDQLKNLDIADLKDFYKDFITDSLFIDYDKFYQNRFPPIEILEHRLFDVMKVTQKGIQLGTFWVERLRDQYFVLQNCWNIIPNKEQYDLFFKIRFDVFIEQIEILPEYKLVIPKSILDYKFQDFLAYGDYEYMEKYCNIFDHIEEMYVKDNVPIYHAERMYNWYLTTYCGLDYHIDKNCQYQLVREISNT